MAYAALDVFGLPAGRRIAVVGAAGGIGRALVAALTSTNMRVAALDLPSSLARHPPAGVAAAVPVDATDETAVEAALEEAAGRLGGLDALVNLAGFTREKASVADTPPAAWDEVIEGNLRSTFLACRAALPHLRAGREAAIVNVSSGLALKPTPGYGPYAAAKAGVLALTRLIAQENAPQVRANAVAPAAVDTAFLRGGTGRGGDETDRVARLDVEAYVRTVPLGRMAAPADVVGPILFLLSPASGYVTGHTLHVNGGLLMV